MFLYERSGTMEQRDPSHSLCARGKDCNIVGEVICLTTALLVSCSGRKKSLVLLIQI